MTEEFDAVVEEAKRLEKKLLEHTPYTGSIVIERTLDLEPRDYVDMSYGDLVNIYERSQKIISTAGLGILITADVDKTASSTDADRYEKEAIETKGNATGVGTEEVETKLREMTSEVLKVAEEVAKEPMAPERRDVPPEAQKREEPVQSIEIEFETHPADQIENKIEIEKETPEAEEQKRTTKSKEATVETSKGLESQTPEKLPISIEDATHTGTGGGKEQGKLKPQDKSVSQLSSKYPLSQEITSSQLTQKPAGPEILDYKAEKVAVPVEKNIIVAAVPPALSQSPDLIATKRYEQMEEQVRAVVGERADESTLKRKMLELTKQLFKEKSSSKREELKLQITILKNMLSGARSSKESAATVTKPTARSAKQTAEGDTHVKILDTMLATQQGELSQTKDGIIDSYNKQIAAIRKKFYDDLSATEDTAKRKHIFESFVFSTTSLIEQLPEVLNRYIDYTSKKHITELEKLRGSLGSGEKTTDAAVEERIRFIRTGYAREFASVKGILGKELENLIEVAGNDIFKRTEGKPEEAEARAYEVLKEINETDEGTLLYFLHSKDPEYYKRYERKHVAKAEAIFRAKKLMAQEKGLSDSMVKKYFSHQTEG